MYITARYRLIHRTHTREGNTRRVGVCVRVCMIMDGNHDVHIPYSPKRRLRLEECSLSISCHDSGYVSE